MRKYGKPVLRCLHQEKPEQYTHTVRVGLDRLHEWMTRVDVEATEDGARMLHSALTIGGYVSTTDAPMPHMPKLLTGLTSRGLEYIEQIPPELIAIDGFQFLLSELIEAIDDARESAIQSGETTVMEKLERVAGFAGALASGVGLA